MPWLQQGIYTLTKMRHNLREPTKVQLFRDLETAQACRLMEPWRTTAKLRDSSLEEGKSLHWDGKPVSIIQKGDTSVVLRGEGGLIQLTHNEFDHLLEQQQITSAENKQIFVHSQAWELFQKASPEDLKVANYRYRVIEPYLQGELPEREVVPKRTIRRWKHWFITAVQIYNWGYIGLLPHRTAKGNRNARISDDAWEFIDKIVKEHYETLKQKGKLAVYGILVKEWEKHERTDCCPSHVTFYNRLKQRAGYEQTKKRQGTRAAYQKSPFYWELELSTPRHGERPWQICHIDHTELDIELVCSSTGRLLGRPWATILLDAYSRRVLAVYLSFDCPSYRSCMMVLRTCVQRFERFPETLVVDHGAEFDSVYFETLLAAFKCAKKQRPVARPRFGKGYGAIFWHD